VATAYNQGRLSYEEGIKATQKPKTQTVRRYFVGDKVYYNAQLAKIAYEKLRKQGLDSATITAASKATKQAVDSGQMTVPPPPEPEGGLVQPASTGFDPLGEITKLFGGAAQAVTDTYNATVAGWASVPDLLSAAFAAQGQGGQQMSSDIADSFSPSPACPPPTQEEVLPEEQVAPSKTTWIKQLPAKLLQPFALVGLGILAVAVIAVVAVGRSKGKAQYNRNRY
jgi:hypothetical protein